MAKVKIGKTDEIVQVDFVEFYNKDKQYVGLIGLFGVRDQTEKDYLYIPQSLTAVKSGDTLKVYGN